MDARIQAAVDPLLTRLDALLGTGYDAVLYGSAARGDYRPGRSDINLLLLLPDAGPEALGRLAEPLRAWRAEGQRPPFLLGRAEWPRVADAFPFEIADMRLAHHLLRGEDPLPQVPVAPADLRRAVEREGRSILLRLRQGFAVLTADELALGHLAASSLSAVLLLLRGMLLVAGRTVPLVPDGLIAAAAAEQAGLSAPALLAVVRGREQESWRCSVATFSAYLRAVTSAVQYVDHLQLGSGT